MAQALRHVEISKRAKRDLKRLSKQERDRIARALGAFSEDPPPENLDIDAIAGHPPWMRLRLGDFRVVFRQLKQGEMDRMVLQRGYLKATKGFLVERVVNRRDLDRAVAKLELTAL